MTTLAPAHLRPTLVSAHTILGLMPRESLSLGQAIQRTGAQADQRQEAHELLEERTPRALELRGDDALALLAAVLAPTPAPAPVSAPAPSAPRSSGPQPRLSPERVQRIRDAARVAQGDQGFALSAAGLLRDLGDVLVATGLPGHDGEVQGASPMDAFHRVASAFSSERPVLLADQVITVLTGGQFARLSRERRLTVVHFARAVLWSTTEEGHTLAVPGEITNEVLLALARRPASAPGETAPSTARSARAA